MSKVLYPGKVFMYPCSGLDISQPIDAFGDQFDTFLFVDTNYRFSRLRMPVVKGWREVALSVQIEGPSIDCMRFVESGNRRYREIEPAWRRSRYKNIETGREIYVVLRRGFGQYALHEIVDGTLGMFLHRGDSGGEGGSGVCYLANRRMEHPPLDRLFEVIKRKLANRAFIASDGSNTSICELFSAAQEQSDIAMFNKHNLLWQRMSTLVRLDDRRLTVVWSVTPSETSLKMRASSCKATILQPRSATSQELQVLPNALSIK